MPAAPAKETREQAYLPVVAFHNFCEEGELKVCSPNFWNKAESTTKKPPVRLYVPRSAN